MRAERAVGVGDARPDEHRPARLRHVPADAREPVAERVAPAAVDLADVRRVLGRLAHRHGRGDLDRLERPVVEVRLQPRERRDDVGVPDDEADAPAGHREPLRQRVELDRDLARALGREDRGRFVPVERDVGIGEVVHDDDRALASEVDELLHEGARPRRWSSGCEGTRRRARAAAGASARTPRRDLRARPRPGPSRPATRSRPRAPARTGGSGSSAPARAPRRQARRGPRAGARALPSHRSSSRPRARGRARRRSGARRARRLPGGGWGSRGLPSSGGCAASQPPRRASRPRAPARGCPGCRSRGR